MPKILICAATGMEAQSARQGVLRAGLEGRFEILKTGMGPKNAANALEKHLSAITPRERPEHIISTGFAGSWSPELGVGSWVHARHVYDESAEIIELPAASTKLSRDFAKTTLLCSVTQILEERPASLIGQIWNRLGESSRQLPLSVDMESFSWAQVARRYKIPFSVYRYISDTLEAPLPKFVGDLTRALAPMSEDSLFTRLRVAREGITSIARNPGAFKTFVTHAAHWRRELIEGWAQIAESLR